MSTRGLQRLLDDDCSEALLARIELGLQHEQQHQELMLTDIKHLLSRNPLSPAYREDLREPRRARPVPLRYVDGRDGIVAVGHDGDGFGYDCETPRHDVLLGAHAIANRPVNNGEYREFVRDGGYRSSEWWRSEGWATVQREGWCGPLYWSVDGDSEFTLGGERALDPLAPVCHVSYYEADAFARWAGARLPLEAEWESLAARSPAVTGNFADDDVLQPQAPADGEGALQLYGDVWEWTASPYVPYPRFRPLPGALGEYNGKFMCGQWVLRGGSCASPAGHLRPSYRNFFYPRDRWQFMGIRLAQDR
jgi:ergothioneine biosynthesis protein EgtB